MSPVAAQPFARWKRRVFQTLIFVALGFFYTHVLHGLTVHLEPWSQAIVNAAIKYVYPTDRQQETTVVLFREKDLERLQTHYPVPWQLHADVLNALAVYRPRTVFVDFSFIDRRGGEDLVALKESMCNLKEVGTRVFLAAPFAQRDDSGVVPELLQCAEAVSPRLGVEEGENGVATYPLQVPMKYGGQIASAAFAAYGAHEGLQSEAIQRFDRGDMELIWPSQVSPLNRQWMNCSRPGVWSTLRLLMSEGPLAFKRSCPYTATITVTDLLGTSNDADIERALTGRSVFYGGSFKLSEDLFDSPVFEKLPGVYLHAMAFDNLLTRGENYLRAERHGTANFILDLVLLAVASLLLIFLPRGIHKPVERPVTLEEFEARVHHKAPRVLLMILGVAVLTVLTLHWGDVEHFFVLCLIAYLVYRGVFMKDLRYITTVCIVLFLATVMFLCFDQGPRNILMLLVFAEFVRRVQERMSEFSLHYHAMLATGLPIQGRGRQGLIRQFVHGLTRKVVRVARWLTEVFLPE